MRNDQSLGVFLYIPLPCVIPSFILILQSSFTPSFFYVKNSESAYDTNYISGKFF